MFSSPLAGYEMARRVFGLDDEALADLARSSVHASFADELVKSRLITEIDAWLAQGSSTAWLAGQPARQEGRVRHG